MTTRREVLGGLALASRAGSQKRRAPAVLLRSGWQSVNIGDITHTPGALTLLEKHIPEAELILWPGEIERGVEPMLLRRFPKLRIARGGIGADGAPGTPELREAFEAAAVFVHGSGPSLTSPVQTDCWRKTTGKPYGFYGITVTLAGEPASPRMDDRSRSLFNGSRFLFTRETASLRNLEAAKIVGPTMGFAPDSTFSFDIRDDATGDHCLRANGLEAGRFICAVPRLRYTPYHLIRKSAYGAQEIERRTRVNDRHAEPDHAKMREAIIAWVRKTGGKALLCPEMTYELDIMEPLLLRPLPEDVQKNVMARETYWMPDEAASVYRKAAAVVSFECHSPIIAASMGTPCLYLHQPEDGIKGRMWSDVGLSDWRFEIEEASGAAIAARLLEIGAKPEAARAKVAKAVAFARDKQAEAMRPVRELALG